MNISETIAYAIRKECSRYSLVEWCKEWGFTLEQFKKFLEAGIKGFEKQEDEWHGELYKKSISIM